MSYTQLKKSLSGKEHKSLTMRPNGALGSVKTCLYRQTRAHYNNTACLNLLFKLPWKENILIIKLETCNLPPSSSQSSIVWHCASFIPFTRQRYFKRFCIYIVYPPPPPPPRHHHHHHHHHYYYYYY